MAWIRQLQTSFGSAFLTLIVLIYWTQGFRSVAWTAISYQFKDEFGLGPSASQFFISLAFFPWSIKPLYGILSDCVPIRGKRRLPYLIMASILTLATWLALGLLKPVRSSYVLLTAFLTIQNVGTAMSDVVIDAMIAEATREERAEFAGDLQSLSWLAMTVGGLAGSLVGGMVIGGLKIELIYLLFSLFPALQLVSCSFVKEATSFINGAEQDAYFLRNKDVVRSENQVPCDQSKNLSQNGDSNEPRNMQQISDDRVVKNAREEATLRQRRQPLVSNKDGETFPDSKLHTNKSWVHQMKHTFGTVLKSLRQPAILRPMLWFFLAQVLIPNLSTVMFYYQTDFLHLDASFLGTARVVSWAGLILGTCIYNRYFKHMKLKPIFFFVHVGLSIFTFLDVALVLRWTSALGIPDKTYVLCTAAVADAINQFKFMPFLVLSSKLCPPGIEGTLFAFFMSINNFGATISSFFGAAVASSLQLSSNNYVNLALGLCIQALCTLLPPCFLFLIPNEITGVTSEN